MRLVRNYQHTWRVSAEDGFQLQAEASKGAFPAAGFATDAPRRIDEDDLRGADLLQCQQRLLQLSRAHTPNKHKHCVRGRRWRADDGTIAAQGCGLASLLQL